MARQRRLIALVLPLLVAALALGLPHPAEARNVSGPVSGPVAGEEPSQWQPEEGVAWESGLASWFGPRFQGRRTASGERFDMRALTAAHRTLPFGTRVLVRNPANGLQVVVRVIDHGPRRADRLLDLSRAAAQALGMLSQGVASVQLLPLTRLDGKKPSAQPPGAEPADLAVAETGAGAGAAPQLLLTPTLERSDR